MNKGKHKDKHNNGKEPRQTQGSKTLRQSHDQKDNVTVYQS